MEFRSVLFRLSTPKLPITATPTSPWCMTVAPQQHNLSPTNTGAATIVSGWRGGPPSGSWETNMSPRPMPGRSGRSGSVRLVRGADVGIVGHEHVARLDAGVLGPVLQDPLDRQSLGGGEVLQVRAEEHQLSGLGGDRGLEVPGDHRDRGDRQALDGLAVL